jgi:hypothetical protein
MRVFCMVYKLSAIKGALISRRNQVLGIFYIGVVLFSGSGCATISRGLYQTVEINNIPTDGSVTVFYKGKRVDTTNTIEVLRRCPGTVSIYRKNCYNQYIKLEREKCKKYIIRDIICLGFPLIMDNRNGAIYNVKNVDYVPDCFDTIPGLVN